MRKFTDSIRPPIIGLTLIVGVAISQQSFATQPLPPNQAEELGKLHQTYSVTSQAAIAARKQAELLQTEIVSQQARLNELQGKAERAETELMELQEFDRKKPGKVKPEELEAARGKHLQAQAEVGNAQSLLEQQQGKLTQLKEDLAKQNLATEHSITAYRTRFVALAADADTRRVNSYKIAQQITESANIPCEDLTLSACKTKTQQEVQRRAIEKGAIIVVDSITEIKNLTLEKDEVRSEVHGEISNLKILETKLTDEPATYFMKIQATVTPVIGDSLLEEIQRTVRADMSLQVGDGGLAFNTPESAALEPIEMTRITGTPRRKDFATLLKKAQAGDAQAQYKIAVMYDYGLGDKVDRTKAIEWYGKAAAQSHAGAQAGLAFLYITKNKNDLPKAIPLINQSAKNGDAQGQLLLGALHWVGVLAVKKNEVEAQKLTAKALPVLENMAQMGDPVAQSFVAFVYAKGLINNKKDEARAIEWFEKAALQGNAFAQGQLGLMYQDGKGVTKNTTKAFEWLEKAALLDDDKAQYELGKMYRYEHGIDIDYVKAFEWFEKSALQGNTSAQNELGRMYEYGWGVTKNFAKAFEWYEKAALQGDSYYQIQLGEVYEKGLIVTKNLKKAFEWYEKATFQRDANAQNNFGEMYEKGLVAPQNIAKAFMWYEKSALQGNANAQNALGRMYAKGLGVTKNLKKSFEWYEKAALQGSSYHQEEFGRMYDEMLGDKTKAFEWYEKAALQDNAQAQLSIGLMYLNGTGVAKNEAKAFEWIEKAARKYGDDKAEYQLGLLYQNGTGVAKNETKALELFESAAISLNEDALFSSGVMYLYGSGVVKNESKAFDLIEEAAGMGNAEAKVFLSRKTVAVSGATNAWVKIASSDENNTYANPSTLRKNGHMVKMWELWDVTKPSTNTKPNEKIDMSTKVQSEYDCKEEKVRSLSFSTFSENMGDGEVTYTNTEPGKWGSVSPGSVGETQWQFACGKESWSTLRKILKN